MLATCTVATANRPHLGMHLHISDSSLTGAKLGLAAVMFVYSFLACLLPVVVMHFMDKRIHQTKMGNEIREEAIQSAAFQMETRNKGRFRRCFRCTPTMRETAVSRANCLAAGALLSVGFLHVFMETIECFDDAFHAVNINNEFPLAAFVLLVGFLLILGVEQITLEFYNTPELDQPMVSSEGTNVQGALIRRQSSHRSSVRERVTSLTAVAETVTILPNTMISTDNCTENLQSHGAQHHHHPSVFNRGWIRVITLLFAISLHSIFEGMALGLCNSLSALLTLFAALSVHKIIIAISIGINVAAETNAQKQNTSPKTRKSRLYLYQILAILTFSGASPLGALIGWAVTNQSESIPFLFAQAVLQGLACGTFCYVVFCELLPKELGEGERDKPGKFLFLVLGWALVAYVIAFGPAEE
ncbi:hypothetical protein P879_10371 [Paragonimus westermani]|uniref:Solute carrier family 39 (Zinc transporter), member 1/2/3 n=1 Tax=Paragonimus westermani TaxID=34504 RepID=A0A8T0D729_9TREM|nr:hypothetical protein P879_10371 [Paragonimus westermani]